MLKSLRLKFVCIFMAIVAVMLCVIFGLTIHLTNLNLQEQSLRNIHQAISAPEKPDEHPPLDNNHPLFQPQNAFFILSQDTDGQVVATGSSAMILAEDTSFETLWQAAVTSKNQTGLLPDYDLRYYRTDSPLGQRIVFLDISSEKETLLTLYRNCVLIAALTLLLFLPISIFLAHWAIQPVATAWEQQRQFVADASHELKTPLTVIMTNAELLQNPSHSDQIRQRLTHSIHTTAQDMRQLVDNLLELARADSAGANLQLQPMELSLLVQESVLPFEAVFFEKGLTIQSLIQPGIRVNGDDCKLKHVIDILLDNAQKYAAPGTVTVQLTSSGRLCQLVVQSPGEPISKEDLTNIFKRFYRIDKVRSRNGSHGLGLSIAYHIIAAHSGRIWAESNDGFNSFLVQLPTIG